MRKERIHMETEKSFESFTIEILALVENKHYKQARDELIKCNEVDVAEIIEEILEKLGIEKAITMFRTLPKAVSVEVFSYLDIDEQLQIIDGITEKEIQFILDELYFDDMIDVLEELPANLVNKILEKTPQKERKLINTFLNYPDNCAGSLMTPEYISLQKEMTVFEALAHIKKEGMDSETVYTCYVKDTGRKLEGIVSLRKLVISDNDEKISDLMQEDFVCVNVHDHTEAVSETFKRYGFLAIPVVDTEKRLVGIITVDDILDVIEDEVTEDFERMAGVLDNTDMEYMDISVFRHVRNRFPWLFVLMLSYMVTGQIIKGFEDGLAEMIVLVAYMPMLMGTGGNSGAQSATLVIRGMALNEVQLRDAGRVLWKELRVSFTLGILLSVLNFARIAWLEGEGVLVALTVCSAMIIIVMAAKTIGSMLPMFAKKVKIDPALMANPMIASVTDMVSVVVYFMLARIFLGI
jgi:magnesium transporter